MTAGCPLMMPALTTASSSLFMMMTPPALGSVSGFLYGDDAYGGGLIGAECAPAVGWRLLRDIGGGVDGLSDANMQPEKS